jgi:nucleoside-diphosphate-sugar epimerase
MAGRKFGTGGSEDLTWALNTIVPANVCERYASSRVVAFSTGCVYPLMAAESGGATEETPPDALGEYAQSCLGRERTFQYYSAHRGLRACLFRLNYAVDLRYGVLCDIASAVIEGRPVNASVGHFNAIWQGDACERALLCLERCASPAEIINVTGPELLSTRQVAMRMGELLGLPVTFAGEDKDRAYLSDASKANALFGPPSVGAERLIEWQVHWVRRGGRTLGKPTHFEVTDGKY